MKTVLCYGDSLTWGTDPGKERHRFQDRWTSILESEIGSDKIQVIAEGLSGRTTVFNDMTVPSNLNGAQILPTMLGTHQPLDCVIIMLGTNDLKKYICGNVHAIGRGVERLARITQTFEWWGQYSTPEIVLVSPPHTIKGQNPLIESVFKNSHQISQELSGEIERVANALGVYFFDAATVAKTSPVDGVHLDVPNTRALGLGLVPLLKTILNI